MPDPNLRNILVLVVDDHPDITEVLATVLRYCGSLVLSAESAQDAMRIIGAVYPDVLVSDLNMPERDGFWLIQELRRAGFGRPAIAISADPSLRSRALLAGFSQFMAKPVDPWEFCRRIYKLTGRRDARNAEQQQQEG